MPIEFKNKSPKKATNQGIHTYEGSEVANIGIGQAGFDILSVNGHYVNEDDTVAGSCVGKHRRGWVAFKALGGNVVIQAASNHGEDFTDNGAVPTFAGGGNGIQVLESDVVHGNFKKIYLESTSGGVVLAYRG